jgi:hypothetical protein
MYLQPASIGGGVEFVIAVNGVEKVLQGSTSLTANQWQHVAVTFSGDTVKLYINGSAVATNTSVTADPNQVRATYALLGRGLAGDGFHGMIDTLRVYSDARTASEILTDVRAIYPGYVAAPDAPANIAPSIPGDYNHDGSVDAGDYTIWRDQLGQSVAVGSAADGSGNGIIDQDDFGVWVAHFGQTTPGAGAGSIASSSVQALSAPSPASTIVSTSVAQPLSLGSTTVAARDAAFSSNLLPRKSVAVPQRSLADLDWYAFERSLGERAGAQSPDVHVHALMSCHSDTTTADAADESAIWDDFTPRLNSAPAALRRARAS